MSAVKPAIVVETGFPDQTATEASRNKIRINSGDRSALVFTLQ
jgi:hypothetical protein